MSGLGVAALLIAMLRQPGRAALEQGPAERDALLLRFGLMLAVQLLLFLGLTLLVAFPQMFR